MRPPPSAAPVTLAAIDIGSNSFRLELARIVQGRYQRLRYLKETVRLGGGLDDDGVLGEAAMRRGLECLSRFADYLKGMQARHVRAVATQTLREARNRDAFLARAQEALAHDIEVISGREEARLIYAGVSHLQPGDRPRLVIDIGGRSTEMILGRGHVPRVAESFAVGSVGLSMRWFGDGALTAKAFRAAQVAAGAEIEEALKTFAPSQWEEALGSSGTVSAVSQILAAGGVSQGEITPDGLRWCIERCIDAGHVQRLDLPGLREDRRPVVAGGLALLYTLCSHFGIAALQPSRGALRQGVILDLNQRLRAQSTDATRPERPGVRAAPGARPARSGDMRDRTVRDLQRRFEVDAVHARAVRAAALHLHRGLVERAPTQADTQAMQALGWAADLHEMGQMVSHHDHHRHSAYLLSHADAAGFSQTEQRRLASLVLGQRGGLRKVDALLLEPASAWQLLCLRLAVLLCHARTGMPSNAAALRVDGATAVLDVDAAWAARHPRTMHLLNEESLAWKRSTPYRVTIDTR